MFNRKAKAPYTSVVMDGVLLLMIGDVAVHKVSGARVVVQRLYIDDDGAPIADVSRGVYDDDDFSCYAVELRREEPQAAGAVDPHATSTGTPTTRD